MTVVTLKPELRTAGGETVSIYCDNEWAGDVYLVYREGDLLTGTVQIDTSRVNERNLDAVEDEVRSYISHLTSALAISTSSVVMMYGDIEQILEMEPMDTAAEGADEIVGTYDSDYVADDYEEDDLSMDEIDEEDVEYYEEDVAYYEEEADGYHLSLLSDEGDHVKYYLRDDYENVIGTVAVDEIADTVAGRVDFWVEPDKNEPEEVAEMLFDTFHGDEVNSISFTMNYSDDHIGDIHLQREDYV